MPGTAMEVDVCVCFSNNCNGKESSIGVADEEKESSHGEMIRYLENKVGIVDFTKARGLVKFQSPQALWALGL